jgi:hypothetical protein
MIFCATKCVPKKIRLFCATKQLMIYMRDASLEFYLRVCKEVRDIIYSF